MTGRVRFPADDAVVVVCLPVDGIADAVTAIAQTAGDGVLITDAGSVKQAICRRITGPAAARFVGAHPIAGSERSGFESADARLFVDRPCIVTTSAAGAAMETRCRRFWENLGARVTVMSPEEHDRVLAVTSHLPHVLAAVAAACADADLLPFAGTGFRDTTRVAAGDPVLWRQILCANASQVVQTAERAQERLQQLIESLRSGDADGVERLLDEAAGVRRLSSMSARPEPPGSVLSFTSCTQPGESVPADRSAGRPIGRIGAAHPKTAESEFIQCFREANCAGFGVFQSRQ